MRHRKAGRQFGRNTSHRRAMFRALTSNLVAHERIETTEAKAKELRRVAERMITKAIRLGAMAYTPHDKLSAADRARRQAAQQQMGRFLRRFAVVRDGDAPIDLIEKVFTDLAKRYQDRPGGYTRIIKLGRRRGDNAPMSIIEFVEGKAPEKAEKPKKGSKAKEPAATKDKAAAKSGDAEAKPESAKPAEKSAKPAEGAEGAAAK